MQEFLKLATQTFIFDAMATTLKTSTYDLPLTREQFQQFFGCEPQDVRAELKACGPWHIPHTLKAPAIRRHWEGEGSLKHVGAVTFYGKRSLYRLSQDGYWLEGKCKIEGKEVSGYTSDIMVEVEGNLYTVEVISVRSCK